MAEKLGGLNAEHSSIWEVLLGSGVLPKKSLLALVSASLLFLLLEVGSAVDIFIPDFYTFGGKTFICGSTHLKASTC